MKVYQLMCNSDEFSTLCAVSKENDYLDETDGTITNKWEEYDVRIFEDDKKSNKTMGDFTAIAVTPVFSKKSKELLFEDNSDEVQFLPIQCIDNKQKYYIANVINIVDCVDYERSEIKLYSTGRIMRFKKYVFFSEKLNKVNIFKIPDKPKSAPFVTEEFKKKIEKNKLTGFRLVLVWDSENE